MMTNIYIYVKPLWKVKGFFNRTSWKVSDVHIVRKSWVLSSFSVSVSLCLCLSVSLSLCLSLGVCLCLCVLCVVVLVVVVVVVVVLEGRGGGRETNRTIWWLVPSTVSLRRAGVEQLYQVKPMIGGIGDVLFSIFSQT